MGTVYTNNLAYMKAICILDKQYGICKRSCSDCEKYKRLKSCYNRMSDYEKLCMDSSARGYVEWYDKAYRNERINRRWEKGVKLVGVTVLVFLLAIIADCTFKDNYTSHADHTSINGKDYSMAYNWGEEYTEQNNIYGETQRRFL